MAVTYSQIATTTGTGSAGNITFSNIPGTYTDLVLVANILTTGAANQTVTVNGTSTNYSTTYISGNGSAASSGRYSGATYWNVQIATYSDSTAPVTMIQHYQNYANTTTYKTVLTRTDRANSGAEAFVGLWRDTSAITSITISGGTFTTGSTFSLYGIKAA